MTHPAITSARKQTRKAFALIDKLVRLALPGRCPLCLEPMPPKHPGGGRQKRYCFQSTDCLDAYDRLRAAGRRKVEPERVNAAIRKSKAKRRAGGVR